ncbi:MAG: S-formylglutathione hydrolase [Pseudomonadota bacterium]
METLSTVRSHRGEQGVYRHESTTCHCPMTFSVFLPPQADNGPVPVLWYLSGLTCTYANVMEKGEYRAAAAEHGVAIICPDTSPRGEGVADVPDSFKLGQGAGFYVDATQEPWSTHYHMYSYVTEELPALVSKHFNVDMNRQSIFGHSMGGHGALCLALRHPHTYKSVSAFAPIVAASETEWSRDALTTYLGTDEDALKAYDATELVKSGSRVADILIDQGDADAFLEDGLRPWRLEAACKDAGIPLTLRMQPGYDHSYFFISTFMNDHIKWHAERLSA